MQSFQKISGYHDIKSVMILQNIPKHNFISFLFMITKVQLLPLINPFDERKLEKKQKPRSVF